MARTTELSTGGMNITCGNMMTRLRLDIRLCSEVVRSLVLIPGYALLNGVGRLTMP